MHWSAEEFILSKSNRIKYSRKTVINNPTEIKFSQRQGTIQDECKMTCKFERRMTVMVEELLSFRSTYQRFHGILLLNLFLVFCSVVCIPFSSCFFVWFYYYHLFARVSFNIGLVFRDILFTPLFLNHLKYEISVTIPNFIYECHFYVMLYLYQDQT